MYLAKRIPNEKLGAFLLHELKDTGFESYGGEVAPGFDENGWPLEVDEDGNVLLDIWDNDPRYGPDTKSPRHGKTRRQVPKEFITDLDLLLTTQLIDNEFDTYRDDLRDGRYHPKSLTAIDYTMARNKAMGGEWETKNENKLAEEHRYYNMKLTDGRIIKHKREPTNLNPAFDKKFLGKNWIHVGRKFYYDLPKDVRMKDLDPDEEGQVSTRGFSHYIIERVTSEMKTLKQAKEVLTAIGERIGGFDYGPRKFSTPFPKDPFNIDLVTLHESPEYYKKKSKAPQ